MRMTTIIAKMAEFIDKNVPAIVAMADARGEEGGGEEGRRKYATHRTEGGKRRVAIPSHIL